jgi:hypothetical protein
MAPRKFAVTWAPATELGRDEPVSSLGEAPAAPSLPAEPALPPILQARARRGLPVWRTPFSLHWTSVRCWPGGTPDAWDDALSLGYFNEALAWQELRVPGTTDPGDKVVPGFSPGVVCPGHNRLCWEIGVIHANDAKKARPAFVQVAPIAFWPVLRRGQADDRTRVVVGGRGIDAHPSYRGGKVGANSQACQVTKNPEDMARFIEIARRCIPRQGPRFSLTLIEEPLGSPLLLPEETGKP